MYKLNLLDKISFILIILGSLNWGLIALLNFNLITFLTFNINILIRIIYFIISLSGFNILYKILRFTRN